MIPRSAASPNMPVPITNPSTSPPSTSTLLVPPNTEFALNVHAMHTSSTNFPSPNAWMPSRWISSPSSSSLRDEAFLPQDQAFAAWASGPRVCPGMKFSQVEFTGVLSTVLRRAWVAPSVSGGGRDAGEEVARREVERLVRDSHLIGATISMRRPEAVCLKVSRRQS